MPKNPLKKRRTRKVKILESKGKLPLGLKEELNGKHICYYEGGYCPECGGKE